MVTLLINVIFVLIILGVIIWAIQRLLPLLPLAEPFPIIVHVLLVLVSALAALWLLAWFLMPAGIPVGGWHGQ